MKSTRKATYCLGAMAIAVTSSCSNNFKEIGNNTKYQISANFDLLNAMKSVDGYSKACSKKAAEHLFGHTVKYTRDVSADGIIIHSWYQQTNNSRTISQGSIMCHENDGGNHFIIRMAVESKYTCIKIDDLKKVFGAPQFIEEFGPLPYPAKAKKEVNNGDKLYSLAYLSNQTSYSFAYNFTNCVVFIAVQKE